jgi:hypothetical protein
MANGFDTFSFCPYSSKANFRRFHPNVPLQRDINPPEPTTPPRINKPPPVFASPSVDAHTRQQDETEDEVAILRRQLQQQQEDLRRLQQQQQQQQQQAVPQSQSNATNDSATITALAQLAEILQKSQEMQASFLSQMANKSSETTKEPPMPKWDGNITTKDLYLEQMEVYLDNKYFSQVSDWDKATSSTEEISNHLRSELLKTIPASRRPAYMNQAKCKDGFAFLKLWLSDISPSNGFHKLQCILKFSTFSAGDTPGQTILSEARGLLSALRVINTEALISMRIILSFEEAGRYDGIVTAFRRGDATVVGCTLDHLQQLVQEEDDRLAVMNLNSTTASANRTRKPDPKPPADPAKDQPAATGTMVVPYPPTRGVPFKACSELIKAEKQCPVCFNRDPFHRQVGCPCLAEHDLVIIKDATKAKSIREQHKARPPPKGRNPRGQHVKGGSENQPPPSPAPQAQPPGAPAAENPSARRATSLEPPPKFSQPPPSIPPSGFSDNYYDGLRNQYYDGDEVQSDPEDDIQFDHE